eukprot:CAMPEP_0119564424 /NCGR_PEP_ID=MMETSP1352-20130426/26935_1 /TAXON_ID=265584 /ORGANISM="Stauroneis constricta, Strain CCMP1120" /LENGTH=58 /DNA_ID=CAMNT_0007613189 /DNA_START=1 /DNA_END=174 /DNA_ORIENTATION=+
MQPEHANGVGHRLMNHSKQAFPPQAMRSKSTPARTTSTTTTTIATIAAAAATTPFRDH